MLDGEDCFDVSLLDGEDCFDDVFLLDGDDLEYTVPFLEETGGEAGGDGDPFVLSSVDPQFCVMLVANFIIFYISTCFQIIDDSGITINNTWTICC